jgi:hypothetical protein
MRQMALMIEGKVPIISFAMGKTDCILRVFCTEVGGGILDGYS